MKINRIQLTVEPYSMKDFVVLRIKVERWPGQEVHLERVLPEDDLHSAWDYIWKSAGDELKHYMEEK